MKYIKFLLTLLLPATLLVACDDDENINGGNATVGFESAEITVKETASTLNVPIVVSGDHNGLITLNVEVTDANGTQVETDKTILLTSGNLRMPADVNTVNAELYLALNTNTEDPNRSFTLRITSAQGAQVSTATCKVNIEEVVDAYDKLLGEWTMVTPEGNFAATLSENVAGQSYTLETNYMGAIPITATVQYSATTGLQLVCGQTVANYQGTDLSFFVFDGEYIYNGNLGAMWNDTYDSIEFETGVLLGFDAGGGQVSYLFAWPTFSMTR